MPVALMRFREDKAQSKPIHDTLLHLLYTSLSSQMKYMKFPSSYLQLHRLCLESLVVWAEARQPPCRLVNLEHRVDSSGLLS